MTSNSSKDLDLGFRLNGGSAILASRESREEDQLAPRSSPSRLMPNPSITCPEVGLSNTAGNAIERHSHVDGLMQHPV